MTLINFKLFIRCVRDIITLARFAYLNLDMLDRRDDGTIEDLRELVVEYIICEIDMLRKCYEFVKYIEDDGEFYRGFLKNIEGLHS
jgi:hypothetical protein